MKPGFKPTLWTKKEWQDNRAPACKGCGVGEALDQLQPFRNKSISGMTVENISKANATLGKLMAALIKADGKCGPNQKDTKAGIGEYKKAVGEFEKKLKTATETHTKRANMLKTYPMNLEEVYTKLSSDADYKAALIEYSKTDATTKTLDAFILFKQKKFTDMVRTYGPNNDYNIPGPANTVLLEVFVSKTNLTPDRIKLASQLLTNSAKMPGTHESIPGSFRQMLGPQGASGRFHKSDGYKTYVAKKLPITDSKL
jgi:hypothetical protein